MMSMNIKQRIDVKCLFPLILDLGPLWGGPGQNFHFELFERAPLGGTKAFYRMSKLIFVQKLSHFEVGHFGRIS